MFAEILRHRPDPRSDFQYKVILLNLRGAYDFIEYMRIN